eukprot:TRINITY_DN590_c0_g1_i1.p1 TRINITY_DN590_c0_g1~~TRINITY_DN590_c0_g1_i1.p1  ORF type:complete len:751 (-),score=88.89 TRINITY_DN590_c0_g1_i1:742-2994(-)
MAPKPNRCTNAAYVPRGLCHLWVCSSVDSPPRCRNALLLKPIFYSFSPLTGVSLISIALTQLAQRTSRHLVMHPPSRRRRKQAAVKAQADTKQSARRPPVASNFIQRTVALHTHVSSLQYASWTSARRRAWDRRFSDPSSYFYHYCHPKFDTKAGRWSVQEHCLFLSAISRIPPTENNWHVLSLLVPGRTGSDCRRYYHRIGRAGLITVRGTLRKRIVSRASVATFDSADKKTGRLCSTNSLFRKNALRPFLPFELPPVDDSLLKPFTSPPTTHLAHQLDARKCLPAEVDQHDRRRINSKHDRDRTFNERPCELEKKKVPCRLLLRSNRDTSSLKGPMGQKLKVVANRSESAKAKLTSSSRSDDGGKALNLASLRQTTSVRQCKLRRYSEQGKQWSNASKMPTSNGCESKPGVGERDRATPRKDADLIDCDYERNVNRTNASGSIPETPLPSITATLNETCTNLTESKKQGISRLASHLSDAVGQSMRHGNDQHNTEIEASTKLDLDVRAVCFSKGSFSSHAKKASDFQDDELDFSENLGESSFDSDDPDNVLDMVLVDEFERSQCQTKARLQTGDAGTQIAQPNKKRVLAPTHSERTSISFLINGDGVEPERKQQRVTVNSSTELLDQGSVSSDGKMEEMGLLLRLFAGSVEETGKALGHEFERYRLLQRFNEFVIRVRSGCRESSLFHAARLLPADQNQCRITRSPPANLDCPRCMDGIVDSWRQQLDDMMERQKVELTSALKTAQVL